MMALMPVSCCRTASPRPIISGVRQRGANTSPRTAFDLSAQRLRDRRESRLGVVLGAESDERAEGVLAAANLGEPARRLDSDQHGEREEGARDRRDPSIVRQPSGPASAWLTK